MRLVWGRVTAMVAERSDVQRVEVDLGAEGGRGVAVVFPALCGRVSPGDRVLCNTTAVDLGLGTGGEHFIVARDTGGVAFDDRAQGHIIKLRYTPLQCEVTAIEEPVSPHHATMAAADSLAGMPVVCCGLHSQVAHAAAAIKERAPDARVAYVMTDGAALALPVSRLVPDLLAAGLLDETITCGQAFGGLHEAVTLHSGLLAARHALGCDAAIVAIGPGIPGTATPFGHGGVAQGEALNAVCALGGRPIAALRLSLTDPRPRHVPVSHQTIVALMRVTLRSVEVAVPVFDDERDEVIDSALSDTGVCSVHTCRRVRVRDLPAAVGINVRTMGRSEHEDPVFFAAAAAAGELVAMP